MLTCYPSPAEIQIERLRQGVICNSAFLSYRDGYFLIFYVLFIYLGQGFWKATLTLPKMLLESLWRYKGRGLWFTCHWSKLHLCLLSACLFFKFYSSTLNVALEIILSDS